MKEYKWMELIKLNIGQIFSEKQAYKEKRKEYRKDIFVQRIPVESRDYCDFAPESQIKNGDEYINALHWGIKNDNVKNIALAGPYGSGKSSVIQTYLSRFPSTKALKISLATFDLSKFKEEEFENQIELGILKQLFYRVDSDRIPQSRYRKLKKKYYKKYFLNTLLLVIMLLMGIVFFFPKALEHMCNHIVTSGNYYGFNECFSYIIVGGFGLLGIALIAYFIRWITTKFKVKEINIADTATVAGDGDNDSIFDRAMDEIMYFFEATDFNVVFIEDLDRFESTEIFVKLRELNTILNQYELIKRKVVFVYAIKDDMFANDERTKFFDFIIPVIPIINSTNSGEILREKLDIKRQENGVVKSSKYDISARYVTLISPFIEDMRVLNSICNEFVVYKNTLNSVKLKDEEMFSFMIFKNLYPKEFAELELETGAVKQAFEDKGTFVKNKIDMLLQERTQCETKLSNIENDVLHNVKEVKAAMLDYIVGDKGSFTSININGYSYSYFDIMREGFDLTKLDSKTSATVSGQRGGNFSVANIGEKIRSPYNYFERIQNLRDGEADRKEQVRNQIDKLNIMLSQIQSLSLKKLIEQYGIEEIFCEEVIENKLLIYLLREGFINENYADYINYFHPNSITKHEMNFVRGIRMQDSTGDFSYSIRNVEEVCARIEEHEFRQKEVLNFDMLDYLLTSKDNSGKCKKFIEGLANGKTESIEFIKAYISRNMNLDVFIRMLCKQYCGFVKTVVDHETMSTETKYYYYSLILEYADLMDIVSLDNFEDCHCISHMLTYDAKALVNLNQISQEKMIHIIEQLGISFINIDVDGVNEQILEHIFKNNKYVLNLQMQKALFLWKFPHSADKLKAENYTVTCENAYEPFVDRIHGDFERYVTDFIVAQDGNTCESEVSVEDMIERLIDVDTELCKKVIEKSSVVWNDLVHCCVCSDELTSERKIIWDFVLEECRIDASWNNYSKYYQEYGMTGILVHWFDECSDSILKSERIPDISDSMLLELLSEDISLSAFEKVINKYKVEDFNCKVNSFDLQRLALLIQNDWIPFSLELFKEIRECERTLILCYAIKHKDEFLEKLREIDMSINDVTYIIASDLFNEQEKVQLLQLVSPQDINLELARVIRIIKQKMRKEYAEAAWELLMEEEKYELLLNQLEVYTVEEISNKFSTLAPAYKALAGISNRHKESLPKTDYNKKLLDKLLKKHYITSYEEEIIVHDDFITHQKQEEHKYVLWVKQKQ